MRRKISVLARLAAMALLFATATAARAAQTLAFRVTLDAKAAEAALPEQNGKRAASGRLYVFLSQRDVGQPISGPNWFHPEPFFGIDVRDLGPGATRRVDESADGFPRPLSKLPAGKYRVQAIFDHDFYCQNHARGVGNLYSDIREMQLDPAAPATVELVLNHAIGEEPFPTEPWLREIALKSELLSQFHGREVIEHASVILPAGYDREPQRRYPVVFEIPGFGGPYRPPGRYRAAPPKAGEGETDFIRVRLSGNCKWGHHVYADSATNGPRGEALVREMIPHVDAQFRTIPQSTARFVTGHSSGGWASLWLQVTYPDTFGGCWSTSPDPVDFRDFQQVGLYADPPLSLYYDAANQPRPIARRGREPTLFFPNFGKMDDVLGRGGQLRSFEAVFSPLDADGLPRKLWDRTTGRIDPEVARAWQKYDIRLVLERNWASLGPKLAGKLHIVTGELDTFYLDGAVRKLADTLKELGSDAEVTIVPGKGHGDIETLDLARQIRQGMTGRFRASHP